MKLSIVILCWNDLAVIRECLGSIYRGTASIDFEVIVSDNGSMDGSDAFIRENYPEVRIINNGANLGFAAGNNAGIRASQGEYVLILNPDTIIHEGCLDRWVAFADRHAEAGAFGCRVVNPDGSYQISARPFPTVTRDLIAAAYLRPLAYLSKRFLSDIYVGWEGATERTIDWQSGCCVMFRRELLQELGGFDERFFYHYEEVDLCKRVWQAGYQILFTPVASITHLGGQSVGRFPVRFALERERNRYRYYYKYFGKVGVRRCRRIAMLWLRVRKLGYGLVRVAHPTDSLERRLNMYGTVLQWTKKLDAVRFVEYGEEPDCGEIIVA